MAGKNINNRRKEFFGFTLAKSISEKKEIRL